jgi:peptide/nickel transport system permease protein
MADLRLRSIIAELFRSAPGKTGLILLGLLSVVSMLVILLFPFDFGSAVWSNPSVWADNPKSVPPAWSNLFSAEKRPPHSSETRKTPDEIIESARAVERVYRFAYDLDADFAPTFLSMSIANVTYSRRPPVVTWILTGPDGRSIDLERFVVSGPRQSEESPYRRYEGDPRRSVAGSDGRLADGLVEFFSGPGDDEPAVSRALIESDVVGSLFGLPGDEGFVVLRGSYVIEARVVVESPDDRIGSVGLVVGGGVYGAMGTDALGRDLALGLLYGLPVALLIGLATSTVSTLIGMSLGLVSGYSGGVVDLVIQRSADIVANIPVLPLLIFLVFIGGSQLWLILLVLVAFSWPGLAIMVRTMVLQLATGQEVEATRALGARDGRIIIHHILPHAASYVLAQLVFFAPSAILAEAGLSFLGLGDPRIPTWGQILEYGFRTGAVFLGYWWWVIPPGLLIVLTAVTFMFLALGLEPVVDPRLRGRRSWHF